MQVELAVPEFHLLRENLERNDIKLLALAIIVNYRVFLTP